jgi:hypothetical protein
MLKRRIFTLAGLLLVSTGGYISAFAQGTQPQIPTLQVCNQTQAEGSGRVTITSRADLNHSGKFTIDIKFKCDPVTQYPTGEVKISGLSMSDSIASGTIASTNIDQVTTTGKHTPIVYLSGRCSATGVKGCRYWLMIADNIEGTPDIVSFLVFDGTGKRVAHGAGPLAAGDLKVQPNGN